MVDLLINPLPLTLASNIIFFKSSVNLLAAVLMQPCHYCVCFEGFPTLLNSEANLLFKFYLIWKHSLIAQASLIIHKAKEILMCVCICYIVVEKLKVIMEEIEGTITSFKENQRKQWVHYNRNKVMFNSTCTCLYFLI